MFDSSQYIVRWAYQANTLERRKIFDFRDFIIVIVILGVQLYLYLCNSVQLYL